MTAAAGGVEDGLTRIRVTCQLKYSSHPLLLGRGATAGHEHSDDEPESEVVHAQRSFPRPEEEVCNGRSASASSVDVRA